MDAAAVGGPFTLSATRTSCALDGDAALADPVRWVENPAIIEASSSAAAAAAAAADDGAFRGSFAKVTFRTRKGLASASRCDTSTILNIDVNPEPYSLDGACPTDTRTHGR